MLHYAPFCDMIGIYHMHLYVCKDMRERETMENCVCSFPHHTINLLRLKEKGAINYYFFMQSSVGVMSKQKMASSINRRINRGKMVD